MARWQGRMFSFMLENAQGHMDCFHLPPPRVVAPGSQPAA
ncbi:hypothetical protein [Kushneria sinocarnis]